MKKLISLLLVLCLVLSFAACGDKDADKDKPTVTTPADNDDASTPTETTAPDVDLGDDRYDDDSNYEGDVSIVETVVYDKNDIKIVATKLDIVWHTPVVMMRIENNSTKDIFVSADELIVNNVSTYGYISADVAAGKKAIVEMELYNVNLTYAQIGGFEDIGTICAKGVEIYDDKWETIDMFDFEIKTSIADTVNYTPDTAGTVIFEDKNVKISQRPIAEPLVGDAEYVFAIENKTDKALNFSWDDVAVNGYMADIFAYNTVQAHTVGFAPMNIYDADLEGLGIKTSEITDIVFKIEYWDEDYNVEHTTDEITITVK